MKKTLFRIAGLPVDIDSEDGSLSWNAGMTIDADGANGQNGQPAAYRRDDTGTDRLANAGFPDHPKWYRDILVCDNFGKPIVMPDGSLISRTAYKHRGKADSDPAAWVDSETVPYVVVPPKNRKGVPGIVLGCKALVALNGKVVQAVVADIGPRHKLGEASIAAARALGIPSSPRHGGRSYRDVFYQIWPGVPAVVNGVTYELQLA